MGEKGEGQNLKFSLMRMHEKAQQCQEQGQNIYPCPKHYSLMGFVSHTKSQCPEHKQKKIVHVPVNKKRLSGIRLV